jgi:hypothetical protein
LLLVIVSLCSSTCSSRSVMVSRKKISKVKRVAIDDQGRHWPRTHVRRRIWVPSASSWSHAGDRIPW